MGTDDAVQAAARAEFAADMDDQPQYRMTWDQALSFVRHAYLVRARAGVAAAGPHIAAKALRDYADTNHTLGEGAGPTWAGSEPVDAWAACTCGAMWCEDGCTERQQLLAAADQIEQAARPAGKAEIDG